LKVALLVKGTPVELRPTKSGGYVREELILNETELSAAGFINKLCAAVNDVTVDVVSMGPEVNTEVIVQAASVFDEELWGEFYLLSDPRLKGSDTYATSNVLASFLKKKNYQLILTGSYTQDSATSFVPAQIAHILGYAFAGDIVEIVEVRSEYVHLKAGENWLDEMKVKYPALLAFAPSKVAINFGRIAKALKREVKVIEGDEIEVKPSLTEVVAVEKIKFEKKAEKIEGDVLEKAKRVLEIIKGGEEL